MSKKVPMMLDTTPYEVFGINNNKVVKKYGNKPAYDDVTLSLKRSYSDALRVIDVQDFSNSFKWYFLDVWQLGLQPRDIERFVYYRGQLILFYYEPLQRFMILPFTMVDSLNYYSQMTMVRPIPYTANVGEKEKNKMSNDELLMYNYHLMICRDASDIEMCYSKGLRPGIVIKDRINDMNINYNVTPFSLQTAIIDAESDLLPFIRTNLLNGLGIRGVRTQQESSALVEEASKQLYASALEGRPFIGLDGRLDFQEMLVNSGRAKVDELLLTLQSYENIRLKQLGLGAGSIWDKKGTVLQSEFSVNQSQTERIYNDRLAQRQEFCTLASLAFGLPLWVEPSETVMQQDMNLDGKAIDEKGDDEIGDYDNEMDN